MLIDVSASSPREIYPLLIGLVTPRPIAWVTSADAEGSVNLAPFSFFNAFGSSPPVLVFSPGLRRDGTPKDTLRNVRTTGEFVVNAAVESLAEQVNLTSKDVPYGASEVELARLTVLPSTKVRVPRLAESPVNLECRVLQITTIGTGHGAANLVIGEVLIFHIADAVLDEHGRVDPRRLRTIGRLGADSYCRTTDIFEMKRPL
jgi:flavin reductase (DIM6/NTAB) family NADH-FMN oxidoreductase RutF